MADKATRSLKQHSWSCSSLVWVSKNASRPQSGRSVPAVLLPGWQHTWDLFGCLIQQLQFSKCCSCTEDWWWQLHEAQLLWFEIRCFSHSRHVAFISQELCWLLLPPRWLCHQPWHLKQHAAKVAEFVCMVLCCPALLTWHDRCRWIGISTFSGQPSNTWN